MRLQIFYYLETFFKIYDIFSVNFFSQDVHLRRISFLLQWRFQVADNKQEIIQP